MLSAAAQIFTSGYNARARKIAGEIAGANGNGRSSRP
jgi:hypothetical protein